MLKYRFTNKEKRQPKVPSSNLNYFHFNNIVLSLKTIEIFPVGFVSSFYEIMSVFYFVFQSIHL